MSSWGNLYLLLHSARPLATLSLSMAPGASSSSASSGYAFCVLGGGWGTCLLEECVIVDYGPSSLEFSQPDQWKETNDGMAFLPGSQPRQRETATEARIFRPCYIQLLTRRR